MAKNSELGFLVAGSLENHILEDEGFALTVMFRVKGEWLKITNIHLDTDQTTQQMQWDVINRWPHNGDRFMVGDFNRVIGLTGKWFDCWTHLGGDPLAPTHFRDQSQQVVVGYTARRLDRIYSPTPPSQVAHTRTPHLSDHLMVTASIPVGNTNTWLKDSCARPRPTPASITAAHTDSLLTWITTALKVPSYPEFSPHYFLHSLRTRLLRGENISIPPRISDIFHSLHDISLTGNITLKHINEAIVSLNIQHSHDTHINRVDTNMIGKTIFQQQSQPLLSFKGHTVDKHIITEIINTATPIFAEYHSIPLETLKIIETRPVACSPTDTRNLDMVTCTYDDIELALLHLSKKSGAGLDGWTAKNILRLDPPLFQAFQSAFREWMVGVAQSGTIDPFLSASLITFIPKIRCPTDFSDMRPIELDTLPLKLASTMVAQKLQSVASSLFSGEQFGFLRGRLGLTAALIVDQRIKEGWDCVFVDSTRAFTNTHMGIILKISEREGFPPSLLNWIRALSTPREARILHKGRISKDTLHIYRGLRQGNPASPLLYNLLADLIRHIVLSRLKSAHPGLPFDMILFADDFALLVPPGSDTKVFMTIAGVLKEVEKLTGVHFNNTKTKILSHTLREGVIWEQVPYFKYLGIRIPSSTAPSLIDEKILSMKSQALALRKWCLPIRKIAHIFNSFFLSRVLFLATFTNLTPEQGRNLEWLARSVIGYVTEGESGPRYLGRSLVALAEPWERGGLSLKLPTTQCTAMSAIWARLLYCDGYIPPKYREWLTPLLESKISRFPPAFWRTVMGKDHCITVLKTYDTLRVETPLSEKERAWKTFWINNRPIPTVRYFLIDWDFLWRVFFNVAPTQEGWLKHYSCFTQSRCHLCDELCTPGVTHVIQCRVLTMQSDLAPLTYSADTLYQFFLTSPISLTLTLINYIKKSLRTWSPQEVKKAKIKQDKGFLHWCSSFNEEVEEYTLPRHESKLLASLPKTNDPKVVDVWSPWAKRVLDLNFRDLRDKPVYIYTDGSCISSNNSKVAAFACVFLTHTHESPPYPYGVICGRIPGNQTSMRAEIAGVIRAAALAVDLGLQHPLIVSDSLTVVNLARRKGIPKENRDLWNIFFNLSIEPSSIIWVKAHSIFLGNILADFFAGKMANDCGQMEKNQIRRKRERSPSTCDTSDRAPRPPPRPPDYRSV